MMQRGGGVGVAGAQAFGQGGSWCIIGCRSLYSGVLVMAGCTQISVWIFCVCYRQMKACTVIGIQLILLALELVALRRIAHNAGR